MAGATSVSDSDYEELSGFLASFPGEANPPSFWLDRLALWWDRNPAFRTGSERGWVLRKDGAIVGFCGMVPSWFQRGGNEEVAVSATTWRVLPGCRSQSLSLFVTLLHAAKESMVFCTTPGEATVAVLKAMKFQLLPRSDSRRSVVPVNAGRVARAQLGDRLGGPVLAGVLACGLDLWNAARLRHLRRAPSGVEVRELAHADARFDGLWERTKGRYPNTNVRRAEVVNWLCFGHRAIAKTLFGCYRNGDLVGYGVFRLNAGNRAGLKVFECLDLWLDPADRSGLGALVGGAARHAETHSYDLLAVPHFSRSLGSALSGLGLIRLDGGTRRDYFRAAGPDAGGITEANSYFVTVQGDDGL